MKNKLSINSLSLAIGIFGFTNVAFAHTAVTPTQAPVDTFQTFTLSTHPEKNSTITKTRLIIPDGVNYVTPYLKSGWKIDLVKEEDNTTERPRIKEIIWSGSSISPDFHEEFTFSAKLPPTEVKLNWKIEQTFADKTTFVSDIDPDSNPSSNHGQNSKEDNHGLMSQTKVVNASPAATSNIKESLPIGISIIALVLSLASFIYQRKNSKK